MKAVGCQSHALHSLFAVVPAFGWTQDLQETASQALDTMAEKLSEPETCMVTKTVNGCVLDICGPFDEPVGVRIKTLAYLDTRPLVKKVKYENKMLKIQMKLNRRKGPRGKPLESFRKQIKVYENPGNSLERSYLMRLSEEFHFEDKAALKALNGDHTYQALAHIQIHGSLIICKHERPVTALVYLLEAVKAVEESGVDISVYRTTDEKFVIVAKVAHYRKNEVDVPSYVSMTANRVKRALRIMSLIPDLDHRIYAPQFLQQLVEPASAVVESQGQQCVSLLSSVRAPWRKAFVTKVLNQMSTTRNPPESTFYLDMKPTKWTNWERIVIAHGLTHTHLLAKKTLEVLTSGNEARVTFFNVTTSEEALARMTNVVTSWAQDAYDGCKDWYKILLENTPTPVADDPAISFARSKATEPMVYVPVSVAVSNEMLAAIPSRSCPRDIELYMIHTRHPIVDLATLISCAQQLNLNICLVELGWCLNPNGCDSFRMQFTAPSNAKVKEWFANPSHVDIFAILPIAQQVFCSMKINCFVYNE